MPRQHCSKAKRLFSGLYKSLDARSMRPLTACSGKSVMRSLSKLKRIVAAGPTEWSHKTRQFYPELSRIKPCAAYLRQKFL